MKRTAPQLIRLQAGAPEKPALGAPCNGCGVCCAMETCPSARLLLRQRLGPCRALLWIAEERRYRCGLLVAPETHIRWLPAALRVPARRLLARWISAGSGCDTDCEVDGTAD